MNRLSYSYQNLSVKAKITLFAVIMVVFTLIIGINGFFAMRSVDSGYDVMAETASGRRSLTETFKRDLSNVRMYTFKMMVLFNVYDDSTEGQKAYNDTVEAYNTLLDAVDEYNANASADTTLKEEARQKLLTNADDFLADVQQVGDLVDEILEASEKGDLEKASEYLTKFDEVANDANEVADVLRQLAYDRESALRTHSDEVARVSTVVGCVILVIILILSIILSIIIAKQISLPIIMLTDVSEKMAKGDLNVQTSTNLTNEVGKLSNNFAVFLDIFREMMGDMSTAFEGMKSGDINARIDASKYPGEYGHLAENINGILGDTANELTIIANAVSTYAEGNFDYNSPRFPGDKAVIHESLDKMKQHIFEISNAIDTIIGGINEGNLQINIDSSRFEYKWKEIIENFNLLVRNVEEPIRITKESLAKLAKGNFDVRVDTTRYKGEFFEAMSDINTTAEVLSDYIEEISDILSKMANQNLNVSINHEYIGDFAAIQQSLELIINNFNHLIKEIIVSSEQVAIGSQSIADSSTALAQGASEQASAVEELTATIGVVAENTKKNMDNVIKSNELADQAKLSAEQVRDEMKELLNAMEAINESSNNISNIIKVIDDIAFQTNILALNASVEAARAGEHGKGFAVVADEVRTLAARSQTSAKETSDLVEESLRKVAQGSEIVNRTARTIKDVTVQIEEISEISTEVANDSKEQTTSISEINVGINQIATVVSNNTATSEESAAASEELASQSAVFKESVSKFVLKR